MTKMTAVAVVASALVCGALARASPFGVSSLATLFQGLDLDQDGSFTVGDADAFYAINGVAHEVGDSVLLCGFFQPPFPRAPTIPPPRPAPTPIPCSLTATTTNTNTAAINRENVTS